MADESFEYYKFFYSNQEVRLSVHLVGNKLFDDYATIRFIQDGCIDVELDRDAPSEVVTEAGAESVVTSLGGWAHFRCHAVLEGGLTGRELKLRLTGPVIQRQQREYFRMDVSIPLLYTIPEDQQLLAVQEEWLARRCADQGRPSPVLLPCEEGFKVVGWHNGQEIPGKRVNLSGGGVRFLVNEQLAAGTLLHLEIFLPLVPAKVIHAVAMVIRVQELLLNWDKHTRYSSAMKFLYLDEKDREAIISYLFVAQRNQLKSKTESRR